MCRLFPFPVSTATKYLNVFFFFYITSHHWLHPLISISQYDAVQFPLLQTTAMRIHFWGRWMIEFIPIFLCRPVTWITFRRKWWLMAADRHCQENTAMMVSSRQAMSQQGRGKKLRILRSIKWGFGPCFFPLRRTHFADESTRIIGTSVLVAMFLLLFLVCYFSYST